MSLLVNRCPENVEIGGKIYKINTSHRASISFEIILSDGELDEYKVYEALRCYFDEIPDDIEKALEAAIWFYSLGQVNSDKVNSDCNNTNSIRQDEAPSRVPSYSFIHDDEYIFASFMQTYNIDLTEEDIHWWKFRPLFNGLPEDTMIKKIIEIREMKIDSKMSAEEKRNIRKLKRQFSLPMKTKDEPSFEDAMASLF